MSGKLDLRWKIAILLFVASALNCMDRNALAILSTTIQSEFNWSDVDYANITVCFVLSYTIMYAFSGRTVDKIGTRKGFVIFGGGWSIVSMLHAFASTIGQFSVARFLLGATESANFPAGVKACAEWFPLKERALAIGIFNAGTSIGAAVAVPLLTFAAYKYGWRSAFLLTGVLGIIWLVFWLRYYCNPKKPESEIIETKPEEDETPVKIKTLLSKKATWGCISARVLIDPVTYFLLFWIPKYLQDVQGLSLTEMGCTAWLPYVAMGVGTVLGGVLPKLLIDKLNWSLDRARKSTMLLSSLLMPLLCYFLFAGTSTVVAVILLAGIMLAHGLWANITIPSEIYPPKVQATLTGVGGTIGGIAGIISQKAIGTIVSTVSYLPIFVYIGSAYMISFILVLLLVGKLGVMHKL